jgi:hypothetical protein
MAHTQRNHPRTPSARSGANQRAPAERTVAQNDPDRGRGDRVTNSPRKRAPQAAAGKRHE